MHLNDLHHFALKINCKFYKDLFQSSLNHCTKMSFAFIDFQYHRHINQNLYTSTEYYR
jgi:hypothetical protein